MIKYHEKFSIPFACFTLSLIAFSLGLQQDMRPKASGLTWGLIFFLGYYLLLALGSSLGESGLYPPVIGMWVPNIVSGAIGGYLFWRTASENPVDFAVLVKRVVGKDILFRRWR